MVTVSRDGETRLGGPLGGVGIVMRREWERGPVWTFFGSDFATGHTWRGWRSSKDLNGRGKLTSI